MSYHQGMPFWANTNAVSSVSNGFAPDASAPTPVAFKVLMTKSCGRGSAERKGSRRAAYGIVPRQIGRNGGSLMSANPVLWKLDDRGVATVTLNRPEVNNAYDGALIQGVLAAMDDLAGKPLRVVVLKGNGRHFQAGADLKWINSVRPQSPDENEAASRATFEAVQR